MTETAVTIGFFDGLHLGHQHLIASLCQLAREERLRSCVVTFGQHPRQVLCPDWQPQLLTTPEEKRLLLAATGVDQVEMLTFTREMAALTARQFMEQVLRQQLSARLLLTGFDNRFGHGRQEGFPDYEAYGRELGISVIAATPFALPPAPVGSQPPAPPQGITLPTGAAGSPVRPASSLIRVLVAKGDVTEAARLLGRPYSLTASVTGGFQVGRTLGFPTANLQPIGSGKLVPGNGVYAVRVGIDGERPWRPGMMNIGTRPTFGSHPQTLEVHLLHFSSQLYGHRMEVVFVAHLRNEQRFSSPAELVSQLKRDAQQTEDIFSQEEHRRVEE